METRDGKLGILRGRILQEIGLLHLFEDIKQKSADNLLVIDQEKRQRDIKTRQTFQCLVNVVSCWK